MSRYTVTTEVATVKGALSAAVEKALRQGSEHLLTTSNNTVPIRERTLRDSGRVDVDARAGRAAISYDTPYAVRQHEDLTLRHDSGRRAKFLESALTSEAQVVGQIIARGIRLDGGS